VGAPAVHWRVKQYTDGVLVTNPAFWTNPWTYMTVDLGISLGYEMLVEQLPPTDPPTMVTISWVFEVFPYTPVPVTGDNFRYGDNPPPKATNPMPVDAATNTDAGTLVLSWTI
jgi:hypothetical protein